MNTKIHTLTERFSFVAINVFNVWMFGLFNTIVCFTMFKPLTHTTLSLVTRRQHWQRQDAVADEAAAAAAASATVAAAEAAVAMVNAMQH